MIINILEKVLIAFTTNSFIFILQKFKHERMELDSEKIVNILFSVQGKIPEKFEIVRRDPLLLILHLLHDNFRDLFLHQPWSHSVILSGKVAKHESNIVDSWELLKNIQLSKSQFMQINREKFFTNALTLSDFSYQSGPMKNFCFFTFCKFIPRLFVKCFHHSEKSSLINFIYNLERQLVLRQHFQSETSTEI